MQTVDPSGNYMGNEDSMIDKYSKKPGQLIVSLDFELFWGMQDGHTLESYKDNVLGGRNAIPRLLKLFEKYGIHATWAVVGFMFADSYEELKRFFPSEDKRPTYTNRNLTPYPLFDWIGTTEEEAPCFYAPSLIRLIAETPGQEIGCHTFSHYYCLEPGQTAEQFAADMKAAVDFAQYKGYTLKTLVFPRNQAVTRYNRELQKLGFIAYRDLDNSWIQNALPGKLVRAFRLVDVYLPVSGMGGYKPQVEKGLVNLPGSRMYKPFFKRLAFLERLKIHRIKRQMLHAAKKGVTFHLWWHPHNIGIKMEYHLRQLEEIFAYYDFLHARYGMLSHTMCEAAEQILNEKS